MDNMFENASRFGYRFETPVGNITCEDLWSLPLSSKSNANLDDIAKSISRNLKEEKETDEFSFVSTQSNSQKIETLTEKLEIVKRVIECKMQENKQKRDAVNNAQLKNKLMSVLERKQDGALEDLSVDELRQRISEIS